jgi:hypothetical protein
MTINTTYSFTPAKGSRPSQSIAIVTTPADEVNGADAIW